MGPPKKASGESDEKKSLEKRRALERKKEGLCEEPLKEKGGLAI